MAPHCARSTTDSGWWQNRSTVAVPIQPRCEDLATGRCTTQSPPTGRNPVAGDRRGTAWFFGRSGVPGLIEQACNLSTGPPMVRTTPRVVDTGLGLRRSCHVTCLGRGSGLPEHRRTRPPNHKLASPTHTPRPPIGLGLPGRRIPDSAPTEAPSTHADPARNQRDLRQHWVASASRSGRIGPQP